MSSTSPYWLSEPAPPLLSAALDGAPDVEVVGAGVTGCSCALALARAGLRVRVHDARQVAGGASGRNGGFALRGGAMPYDSAREWLGGDSRAGVLALDGGRARPAGAARGRLPSGASAACASPPTGRSARSCARNSTPCARTASPPSGATTSSRRSPGASPARSSIRPTPFSSPREWCGGSRRRPREAGVEIREGDRVELPRRARGRARASSPRTATRAGCSAGSRA